MKTSDIQVGESYAYSTSPKWKTETYKVTEVKVIDKTAKPTPRWEITKVREAGGIPVYAEGVESYQTGVMVEMKKRDWRGEVETRRVVVRPSAIRATWSEYEVIRDSEEKAKAERIERRVRAEKSNEARRAEAVEALAAIGIHVNAYDVKIDYGKTRVTVNVDSILRVAGKEVAAA